MAVNLSPVGGVAAQFFTSTGAVLTGGKLYTYAAGTTTPATTYTTSQGNVAWSNPVVLDAAGRVPGSGEIWLTDGVIYKFVLKDSNDVLIATYDNITGINSNSVAYTNQQEIVTATAGQTVFNLGISYQPGTNSLSVFVDGVNQYGPGAQYSYVETDSDTVTFNSGLHVGAEVKFTTTQQQGAGAVDASQVSFTGFNGTVGNVQNLADNDGSDWVGFLQAGTGAVAISAQDKMRQTVSVKDFGAVGDGVTDDTVSVQAGLDYINTNGGVLSFVSNEYTFKITSPLTLISTDTTAARNKKVRIVEGCGATLDFSSGSWSADYLANNQINLFNVGTQVNTVTPSNPQCIIERGLLAIRDLRIVGNEATPPASPDASVPTTGTIGLRLQLAQNVDLSNVIVTNCTVGVETKDSWEINASLVHTERCWIGFSVHGGSTYATWTNCAAVNVAYGVVARSWTKAAAPTYGAFAAVSAQEWINLRVEDAWYEHIVYPVDTAIRGYNMINGYSEGISRDAIVSGFAFNQAYLADPASTLTTPTAVLVDRLSVYRVGRMAKGGGFYAIRTPNAPNGNTVHSDITIPYLVADVSGSFPKSYLKYVGNDTGDVGPAIATDNAGNITFRIDALNGGAAVGNQNNADTNVLDWYEEDELVPTVRTSNSDQGTVTYVAQDGAFTRVGNRVMFNLFVQWSAMSGAATGNLVIGGLPYASNSGANKKSIVSVTPSNLTFTGQISGWVVQNSTEIELLTASSASAISDVAVDTAAGVWITGTYMI